MHSTSTTISALARSASCKPLLRPSRTSQGQPLWQITIPVCHSFDNLQLQRTAALHGQTGSAASQTRANVAINGKRAAACAAFAGGGVQAEAAPAPAVAAAVDADAEFASRLARLFPGGEYSVEMQVRDYELDQFNVVNNAVYSSFFQHGRHEAFAALGHDVDEYARRGSPLALSQMNITFRAPLRSRDVFRVTVAVQRVTGARVVFQQRILKRVTTATTANHNDNSNPKKEGEAEELVAEAEAVVVFLDSQYRPARLPKDATRLFQAVAGLRKA